MQIAEIQTRELLDSRGNSTIEHEALELRDDNKNRYLGKGKMSMRKYFYLGMFLLTILQVSCSKSDEIIEPPIDPSKPTTEQIKSALVEFYNATDGDNWTENTNWCSDKPLNEWYGIHLYGDIITLRLERNNISGTIPASLGGITTMADIDLSNNNLTGEIPAELSSLKNLCHLSLSNNNLKGNIPASLVELTQINYIDLSGNKLSGRLPVAFKSLPYYSSFKLLPQQQGYNLTGVVPEHAGDRAAVIAILKASLGTEWDEIYAQIYADLLLCEFSNVTVDDNGRVTGLEVYAERNRVEKFNMPEVIGNLTELSVLGLHYYSDIAFPDSFFNLTKLTSLTMFNSNITSLSDKFTNFKKLENLDLRNNKLTGSIPAWICELPNLKYIDFDDNKFSGKIPSEIGKLKNLISFSLCNEGTMDDQPIPEWITSSTNLVVLRLINCSLTGEIPAGISALTKLNKLSLSGSKLTGEIPAEISALTELITLNLSGNKLTGSIPDGIRDMKNMDVLFLNNNQLTGQIPTWIGELTKIDMLNLSSNQLTGSIPTGLSNMKNIIQIYLNDNQLSGPLPEDMATLTYGFLFVSIMNNNFTGVVPDSWLNHPYIEDWGLEQQNPGYGFDNYPAK